MAVIFPNLGSICRLVAQWWQAAVVGGAFYTIATIIYRRFFHPLANVPGPFLPAVTKKYAWYFNVPCGGKFYKEIERLHDVYGESPPANMRNKDTDSHRSNRAHLSK